MGNPAELIRNAVERVVHLRGLARGNENLTEGIRWIKAFQSRRFAGTYKDLLDSQHFGVAAQFFLLELYGDRDYAHRDAQFARIAGTLEKVFPVSVVDTAVNLAQLHVLTEELDFEMGRMASEWSGDGRFDECKRYLDCWRSAGRVSERHQQLDAVLHIGAELNRLTQVRGLRMMLRLMRTPAKAAGLEALQSFLESGFDTFASMSSKGDHAFEFLQIIQDRETVWIEKLFKAPENESIADLEQCVGRKSVATK